MSSKCRANVEQMSSKCRANVEPTSSRRGAEVDPASRRCRRAFLEQMPRKYRANAGQIPLDSVWRVQTHTTQGATAATMVMGPRARGCFGGAWLLRGRGVALGVLLRGFRRDARFPWPLSVEEAKTRAFTRLVPQATVPQLCSRILSLLVLPEMRSGRVRKPCSRTRAQQVFTVGSGCRVPM